MIGIPTKSNKSKHVLLFKLEVLDVSMGSSVLHGSLFGVGGCATQWSKWRKFLALAVDSTALCGFLGLSAPNAVRSAGTKHGGLWQALWPIVER